MRRRRRARRQRGPLRWARNRSSRVRSKIKPARPRRERRATATRHSTFCGGARCGGAAVLVVWNPPVHGDHSANFNRLSLARSAAPYGVATRHSTFFGGARCGGAAVLVVWNPPVHGDHSANFNRLGLARSAAPYGVEPTSSALTCPAPVDEMFGDVSCVPFPENQS
jgi:hypothetical protein